MQGPVQAGTKISSGITTKVVAAIDGKWAEATIDDSTMEDARDEAGTTADEAIDPRIRRAKSEEPAAAPRTCRPPQAPEK